MKVTERLNQICKYVDERNFISISELSQLISVSEMTIRRDLERLDAEGRLVKTFGGAVSVRSNGGQASEVTGNAQATKLKSSLAERVDVIVMPVINPRFDSLLPSRNSKRQVPVIAESQPAEYAATTVMVDNYQAGYELGFQVGSLVTEKFGGKAELLDLTYHQSNTLERSQGFLAGLKEKLPGTRLALSLNAQARTETAYQLTRDALSVNPNINVIFAINDSTAWGAVQACQDLKIDPERMIVVTFGLEGPTLRQSLLTCDYCKIGLAMFPEIAGAACIEASIAAFNHQPQPERWLTPYSIMNQETFGSLYSSGENGWELQSDNAQRALNLPFDLAHPNIPPGWTLPTRIGFVQRFSEHEWYINLIKAMIERAEAYGIELELADSEQTLRDEIELRRQEIARQAIKEISKGDTILVDHGPAAIYLAQELLKLQDITVITNSTVVFHILENNPAIILVSTGGVLRRATNTLVGPSAEAMIRDLRASKLFLQAEGVSLSYGLSHSNLSEVTIKQKMIQSAHQVILLADHTCFGKEEIGQIAPLSAVHKIISDDVLPVSYRLEASEKGIEVVVAV